ncbi:hypothetical protein FOZ62_015847 [Perkinsus olseni]|uniref:Uncharacterized protein n=1 Tax=Perkinsus olseni TaxID=32597 RepID=A0A7J6RSG0_PEROL|nr:hypothetical protein FOZ62_015847 [Perkinsus olseni]
MSYFIQEPYQTEVVEDVPDVVEETTIVHDGLPSSDVVEEEETVVDDVVMSGQTVQVVHQGPDTTTIEETVVIDDGYVRPEVVEEVVPDDEDVVIDETTIID